MKKNFYPALLLMGLALTSCATDATLDLESNQTNSEYTFHAKEGVLKFTTNKEWKITVNYTGEQKGWIKVEQETGGSGTHQVKYQLAKNTTDQVRQAEIRIESSDQLAVVQVKQGAIAYVEQIDGTFFLSEGAYGAETSFLGFNSLTSEKELETNFFGAANEGANLGRLATDVIAYGSKLYVVSSGDDQLVILDAASGKLLERVALTSDTAEKVDPRYAVGAGGHVYVSSWHNGVMAVDTATFKLDHTIATSQAFSEELVAHENHLYVVNSGLAGDAFGGQGNTISIISLDTHQEVGTIEVPKNPNKLRMSRDGKMYLATWGDYAEVLGQLHEIDYNNKTVLHTFDFPVSKFGVTDKYIYTYDFSWITYSITSKRLDRATGKAEDFAWDALSPEVLRSPYAITVDDATQEVYYSCESGAAVCLNEAGEVQQEWVLKGDHGALYTNKVIVARHQVEVAE